jgi:signal transduction histidine kinase/DNA-binding response OmpR family regulator/streptogramin lyase
MTLSHPRVTAIAQDSLGRIWIGTSHGLNRQMADGYHQYFAGDGLETLKDNHISDIYCDRSGRIWVLTLNGGLHYLTETGGFHRVPYEQKGLARTSLLQTDKGTILFNSEYALFRFDEAEHSLVPLTDTKERNIGFFPSDDGILVAFPDSVSLYSIETGKRIRSVPLPESCRNAVWDPEGSIWLASRDVLYRIDARTLEPEVRTGDLVQAIGKGRISDIVIPDPGSGKRLINAHSSLLLVDPETGFLSQSSEPGFPYNPGQYNVNCLFLDAEGNVLVGTNGSGVLTFPSVRRGSGLHALIDFFKDKYISDLHFDESTQSLTVTTGNGIIYESLVPFTEIRRIREIREDELIRAPFRHGKEFEAHLSGGRMVSAGYDRDILLVGADRSITGRIKLEELLQLLGAEHFVPEALQEDREGNVWIGTQSNGILLVSPTDISVRKITPVSCDEISSIETDRTGHIWVATQYGLNEYLPDGSLVDSYLTGNGISNNAFTEGGSCVLPDGTILFGSMQGIVPKYVDRKESSDVRLVFEDLKIRNRLVAAGPDSPIETVLSSCSRITLRHNQSSFSILFSALGGKFPSFAHYRYQLEGFDPYMVDAGRGHEAFYSSVPPGNYVFRVQLTDSSGNRVYDEQALELKVKAAPWLTWWAKALYLLLAAGILFAIVRGWNRHLKNREEIRRINQEKQQEQKTNEINKRYFANVAHQLRTPLTMISGPIETLASSETIQGRDRQILDIVRHNVGRMLRLVGQIMDFNKLDSDALALQAGFCDISSVIRRMLEVYRLNADQKEISLKMEGITDNFFVWADADKVENILDNLLSNALKHTPKGGEIIISLLKEEPCFTIRVTDSGKGIPQDQLERVFERYYQVGEDRQGHFNWGTGIGLYYAAKLAELHHGSLKAANRDGSSGAVFSLTLPMEKSAYSEEELQSRRKTTPASDSGIPLSAPVEVRNNEEMPLILVVDDDTDITYYLKTLLSPSYRVVCCYDAASARRILAEEMPEIILSDVMMSGESGYSLCSFVKENLQFCHIPVILLTAKDAISDQIEGLNSGADAYVTKPFNAEFLLSLVDNQLKGRERLRKALSEGTSVNSTEKLSPQDKAFMDKLYGLMEEELSNSEFNIQQFVDQMHMSHSKFIYKVKGLTGSTPSDLFKNFKLNKAAAMLKEGVHNVSEIADMTGFSTLAHFSKSFKKKFGVPPSEY